MKVSLRLVSLFVLVSSSSVFAAGIPNFFQIQKTPGKVYRGADPSKNIDQLTKLGVTDVLIFKNQTKTEVDEEKRLLKSAGIAVKHIPFKWKDIPSTSKACEQAIDALNFVTDIGAKKDRAVFFHCSVGEDRTGLLAGLYRVANEGWDIDRAFDDELCARGWGNGNTGKPAMVWGAVVKELYPVYAMAVAAIEESKSKGEKPNKKYCRREAIVSVKAEKCVNAFRP